MGWENLDLVIFEEFAGGVVKGSNCGLIAGLGLSKREFGGGELGLRIEHKENRGVAELILPFFGVQVFLGQVFGDFGGLKGEFRLLQ